MKDYAIGLALGLIFGGVALALAGALWNVLAFLAGLGALLGALAGRLKALEEVDDVIKAFWNIFITAFVLLLLSLIPAVGVAMSLLFAYLHFVGWFLLFYGFGLLVSIIAKVATIYVQTIQKK